MRPFGSHISVGEDLFNSLHQAEFSGFSACQIFLGPPVTYNLKALSDNQKWRIHTYLVTSGFKVFVHAPYVLHAFAKPGNFGKNNAILAKHVKMAASLGCSGYVVHMGGTKHYEGGEISYTAKLLEVLSEIGKEPLERCPLLLENCASGPQMSGNLISIRDVVREVRAQGYNVGMCLDTLHAYAFGYDWNVASTISHAEAIKGELSLIHLNSAPEKVTCGSRYDRHEGLLEGKIHSEFFKALLSMHPECPVIVERDEHMKILYDWEFVKGCDRRREPIKQITEVVLTKTQEAIKEMLIHKQESETRSDV